MLANVADVQDEKRARSASGIEQSFVGRAWRSVGRAAVKLVEHLLRQPVGRVVFAEVVAQFLRHEVLIKLLEQVACAFGIDVERDEGVAGKLANDLAQRGIRRLVPTFEIPTEEIAFEKIADAQVPENAALFLKLNEVRPQAYRSRAMKLGRA